MEDLIWIEKWYNSMCNGEWEEYYGIKISTIDNPGWLVEIDILETSHEDRLFTTIDIDNGDNDWVICKVSDGKFVGIGDKAKLSFIINVFSTWSQS